MRTRVEISGSTYDIVLQSDGAGRYRYSIASAESTDSVSVVEVMPGLFSLLAGTNSLLVSIAGGPAGLEMWAGDSRYSFTISDPRDQAAATARAAGSGDVEIRTLMPGKVVRILVQAGSKVTAGEGLIVVEAMKMQNELKAPRDGKVKSISAAEGTTVTAGASLLVLE
jgi:acetyl/propionyl-CoA carboxylase alpha subunit